METEPIPGNEILEMYKCIVVKTLNRKFEKFKLLLLQTPEFAFYV